MAAMPAADVATSRIFDDLHDTARRAWLGQAATRLLGRGQTLARQGEPADALYLLEFGLLKLVQVTPDGHELIVRFVGPLEPFGGVVALEGATYPVTALAVEPTRLLVWPRATLVALLARDPQVRTNLLREMTAHMTDALTRVRELATERVGQRLAHTLLRLGRQVGETTPEGLMLGHPLTRQELAELTGTTLYTVSRILSRWQAAGVIESRGRRLLVRSVARLQDLAETSED
jgi:CRP-like cAMP-binding protein